MYFLLDDKVFEFEFDFKFEFEYSYLCEQFFFQAKSLWRHVFCPFFFFFLLPAQVSELSITGRDQTGYTVYAGYCMFPQSCNLRIETAGSL
jgi:hypothetical protein